MLPTSMLNPGAAGASVAVPPPSTFVPLVLPIVSVEFLSNRGSPGRGLTEAQRNGIRYESSVHEYLSDVLENYIEAPWLFIRDQSGARRLGPDGLCVTRNHVIVIEVKIQHMPEAWWQLRQLYEPVVRFWRKNVYVLEIVKSYDPSMPFPEPIELVENLRAWCESPKPAFGVHIWKP